MSTFLSDIPDARLSDYGIEEHIDLDRAVLGTPIPMYLISQYGTQDAKIWRVPLIIDGFYSALFTVEIDESGELRLVDFGANLLAEELQRINSEIHLEGLLRVFELHKDFAIANVEDGSQLFYPIPWQTADKGLTLENINQLISERQ